MWKNRISNNQASQLQSTVTNMYVLGCLICNYRENILAKVRWLLTHTLSLQMLLLDYRRNIASYFFSIHRMIRHGYSSQLVTLYPAGKSVFHDVQKGVWKVTDERKLHLFNSFYTVPYEKQQALILSGLEQVRNKTKRLLL